VFEQTDATKRAGMRVSDAPSDYWYDGSTYYDFTANAAKTAISGAETRRANEFTRLVWKTTTKVGFGISADGRYVVAWFCETPGNT